MNRTVLTLAAGILAASGLLSAAPGAGAADGPVAHWKLDESAGDQVTDSAGDHHGANHGAEVGQPGLLGKALRFNSRQDDYVDFGDRLQLDGGNQATLAALVRPESFNRPDARNMANSRNGILGTADANLIFGLTDRGRLTFVWDAGTNQYQQIVTDPTDVVPLGTFTHVAVVRDGPVMTLYVNGAAHKTERRFSPNRFVKSAALHLGRVNGSAARDFDGTIDDVRVYDHALSAPEVRKLADAAGLAGVVPPRPPFGSRGLERLKYNHPGLVVDLGVGLWAWPLPMDFDGDGDLDLVVSCADVPYNGIWFFENPGGAKMPVFKPAVRISRGMRNVQVSYAGKSVRVTTPGNEYPHFRQSGLDQPVKLPVGPSVHPNRVRANQWKYADYDGNGRLDLVVGVGDWTDYGWDDAFNAKGEWTRSPLHGYVYLLRNAATTEKPRYEKPVKLQAGGRPIDVYGMPSPNLADFDGDGDLDVICGEFVDKLTWFENTGTRTEPRYAAGRFLVHGKKPLRMDLCMIVPVAVDWDGDGDLDLIVGQEDGRVALVENTGRVADRMPVFEPPRFFRQEADDVKFGALVTPVGFDWDGDGDEDLVCGNTAGYIGLIENLDGGCPPRWAAPKLIEAGGRVIRIEAGPNGSIQGPCEAKWGYTTLSVADWDHDGLADLVVNSIWGKVLWYRNAGTRKEPRLEAARPVEVQWPGPPPKPEWTWWEPEVGQLATQWRTTPLAVDFTGDGLCDLVMLDREGYLALFRRQKSGDRLVLLPPERVFVDEKGAPLRLNPGRGGRSGRRKLCLADWDRDGRLDLLVNSRSADLLKNLSGGPDRVVFAKAVRLDPRVLAGHTTSPTVVDWDRDGSADLLVGAEDGLLYYLKNPHAGPVDGQAPSGPGH